MSNLSDPGQPITDREMIQSLSDQVEKYDAEGIRLRAVMRQVHDILLPPVGVELTEGPVFEAVRLLSLELGISHVVRDGEVVPYLLGWAVSAAVERGPEVGYSYNQVAWRPSVRVDGEIVAGDGASAEQQAAGGPSGQE